MPVLRLHAGVNGGLLSILLGLPLALTDHVTREGLLGPKRICFPPALSGSTWVWDSHNLTYWKKKGRSFHKGINGFRRKPPCRVEGDLTGITVM